MAQECGARNGLSRFVVLCPEANLAAFREAVKQSSVQALILPVSAEQAPGFWIKQVEAVLCAYWHGPIPATARAAQLAGQATLLLAMDETDPHALEGIDLVQADVGICADWLDLQRSNPSLRQALGRRALREAQSQCSPAAVVEQLLSLVQSRPSAKTAATTRKRAVG